MTDQHIDPRPDLEVDHREWECLLATQLRRDDGAQNGLYGVLHGFRCEGARLVLDRGRLRIEPGELGDEYVGLRSLWLVPRRLELSQLLETVTERLGVAA